MAVTFTKADHATWAMVKKLIDLSTDTVKVLLMRQGFTFDKAVHGKLINIKTNSTAISLTFTSSTKKIARGAGSFVTDGFVVGNRITTDAALNPGPFTIAAVSALEITTTEALADEGPVTKTVTSDDELATGNGYTQNIKTTGTITVAEDNVNHRTDSTFPTVTWTASVGSIGPTPGAILYDDTTADNIILGYINFGGDETRTVGNTLDISNGIIRMA